MWTNDLREIGRTVFLGVAIVVAFTLANLGADGPTQISACVTKETGEIRILQANEGCKKGDCRLRGMSGGRRDRSD